MSRIGQEITDYLLLIIEVIFIAGATSTANAIGIACIAVSLRSWK